MGAFEVEGISYSRNLGYSKLYDSTNEIYLYVNENGRLNSTAESLDDDRMYWTRSLDGTIENKATGLVLSLHDGKLKLVWFNPKRMAPQNWRWVFTETDDENQLVNRTTVHTSTSLTFNWKTGNFELRQKSHRPCRIQFVEMLWKPELESMCRAYERLSRDSQEVSSCLQDMHL